MSVNPSIDALLDLQVIDKQRLNLRQTRLQKQGKLTEADKAWSGANTTAAGIEAQAEKSAALVRQYTADLQRCDATIADLRSKQMNAKTNKEYMAIINGIEQARVEKNLREQSLKELGEKIEALKLKAAEARAQAAKLKEDLEKLSSVTGVADQPSPEEQALQEQYDSRKATVDGKFLEAYERLVQARHPMPLMRVDPDTRSTPYGARISMNQIEQIRMGKLVICSGTNSILYI